MPQLWAPGRLAQAGAQPSDSMIAPRLANPKTFAHVRRELGIEARPGDATAE